MIVWKSGTGIFLSNVLGLANDQRLSRTQRGRISAPASVGSNRWLGRRERSEPGLPAGAARRAVKPSAKRSA